MQENVQYIKIKIVRSGSLFSLSEMFFVTGGLRAGITVRDFWLMRKERKLTMI